MRDILIGLLEKAEEKAEAYLRESDHTYHMPTLKEICGVYADYLLANGVIVPPCKVGDTVYVQNRKSGTVTSIHQNLVGKEEGRWVVTAWFENYYGDTKIEGFECGANKTFYFADFGKTVFLTREEAEAALAVRKEDEGK